MPDSAPDIRRFRLDISLPRSVPAHDFRHPAEADIPAIGALMWEAYRGTPDGHDAGDGVVSATHEIQLVFDGEHGPFQPAASFVVADDGRLVAAALVTVWKEVPLLAYLFTAPSHTGRGLARRLVEAVMRALGEQGHVQLSLAVTEHNIRARRLYESIGFVRHRQPVDGTYE
jgi:GNAT superfamily N-acetyltransferase